jgi:hypothetical protein
MSSFVIIPGVTGSVNRGPYEAQSFVPAGGSADWGMADAFRKVDERNIILFWCGRQSMEEIIQAAGKA